jgi:hypothetical protein
LIIQILQLLIIVDNEHSSSSRMAKKEDHGDHFMERLLQDRSCKKIACKAFKRSIVAESMGTHSLARVPFAVLMVKMEYASLGWFRPEASSKYICNLPTE